MDIEAIAVFIGIDVGKSEHWATALNQEGRKVFDRALPNEEDLLREVYQRLQAKGQVLVVVDQPATIGALAVAVAQDMGITVGYLPGLSMRRIADLTPGRAKTDAKDAAVIAGAARSMPHTLRAISTSDEEAAALSMLTGFDLDLGRLDRLGPGAPDRGGRRHRRRRSGSAPPGQAAHLPTRSAGRCRRPGR